MFKDLDLKKWYAQDIIRAVQKSLMVGTSPNTFEPDRPVTRAELAVVLVRQQDRFDATLSAAIRVVEKKIDERFGNVREDFIGVVAKIRPAVVQIKQGKSIGSGSFITPRDIITNFHVVKQEDGTPVKIVTILSTDHPWRDTTAELFAFDEDLDLAVYKVAEGINEHFLPLAKYPGIDGEDVLTYGSPHGTEDAGGKGIISKHLESPFGHPGIYIMTDAMINPGNSGGALVNHNGELLGIPTLKIIDTQGHNTNMGLAITVTPTVLGFLDKVSPGNF